MRGVTWLTVVAAVLVLPTGYLVTSVDSDSSLRSARDVVTLPSPRLSDVPDSVSGDRVDGSRARTTSGSLPTPVTEPEHAARLASPAPPDAAEEPGDGDGSGTEVWVVRPRPQPVGEDDDNGRRGWAAGDDEAGRDGDRDDRGRDDRGGGDGGDDDADDRDGEDD